MQKVLTRLFPVVVIIFVWFNAIAPAYAANGVLVPCNESPAFQERMSKAPDTYYFDQPFTAYSSLEMCGEDGLPHLALSFDRAIDIAIPFGLFLYIAGFIGWSGRAYLIATNKSSTPEQKEIFIDLPLAIASLVQGLLWPLLALKELTSGELTNKDNQISVSPR